MLGDVVDELPRDLEGSAGERDLDLAMLADVLDLVLEQADDMRRRRGRGDRHHRLGVGNLAGRGQDGGAAEAVADQDRGRFPGWRK